MKDPHDIIVRPIVTEKSMQMLEENKYTFVVKRAANKIEIKRALEDIFGVKVKAVNTANFKGKKKRLGHYPHGYKPRWKKAFVTLTEDSKSIELFEGR